jgi:hypothetical protein
MASMATWQWQSLLGPKGRQWCRAAKHASLACLEWLIHRLVEISSDRVVRYVERLQQRYPHHTHRQLARHIIHRQSIKNGCFGAVTGLIGLIVLPLDIIKEIRISTFTIHCIAYLYGRSIQGDVILEEALLLIAHSSVHDVQLAIERDFSKTLYCAQQSLIGAGGKVLQDYVLAHSSTLVHLLIWKATGRQLLAITARRSVTKVLPLISTLISSGLDWRAIRQTGHLAMAYYEQCTANSLQNSIPSTQSDRAIISTLN